MKKTFWLLPLLAAIPLLAVTPQFWEIRTYDDFSAVELSEYGGDLSWPRFEDVPELPADGCREECKRQKKSNAH